VYDSIGSDAEFGTTKRNIQGLEPLLKYKIAQRARCYTSSRHSGCYCTNVQWTMQWRLHDRSTSHIDTECPRVTDGRTDRRIYYS